VRFEAPIEKVAAALAVIPRNETDKHEPDYWENVKQEPGRDYMVRVGHAVKAATGGSVAGLALFDKWRSGAPEHFDTRVIEKWRGFKPTEIGFGTLKYLADQAAPGWDTADDKQEKEERQEEERQWPVLHPDALYGLAAKVVAMFDPHTESDPLALLLQFLVSFGNALDRGPYFLVEGTKHYTNLNALLIGETGKSRKGTSADRIRQLMMGVAPIWVEECIKSGLSSGEGLLWVIRDEVIKTVDGVEKVVVEGVNDKRLLLDEREFFQVLTVMKREGNTVSRMIRDAWDGRDHMASLTKNSPARVTKPHISIIGHITGDELLRLLDVVSMVNGYANRFLFACVRRSKFLPFGGSLEQAALDALAQEIKEKAFKTFMIEKQITWSTEARSLWANVYRSLSEGQPGVVGAITQRGDAQTTRLALIYALLDGCEQIKLVHLKAAIALWQYCADSARYIFGDVIGDPLTDELLRALRSRGEMTRTEIRDHFKRNKDSAKIDTALKALMKYGRVRSELRSSKGPGPKVEVWIAVPA
jgi:hypothetical protein